MLFKSFFFSFLCRLRRDRFVSAIWKVKMIQKWEIDSLQGVLDEEKENQGNFGKKQAVIITIITIIFIIISNYDSLNNWKVHVKFTTFIDSGLLLA